jgi:hypothetical protein
MLRNTIAAIIITAGISALIFTASAADSTATAPANAAPANTAPANTAPANVAPASAPSNAAPANSAATTAAGENLLRCATLSGDLAAKVSDIIIALLKNAPATSDNVSSDTQLEATFNGQSYKASLYEDLHIAKDGDGNISLSRVYLRTGNDWKLNDKSTIASGTDVLLYTGGKCEIFGQSEKELLGMNDQMAASCLKTAQDGAKSRIDGIEARYKTKFTTNAKQVEDLQKKIADTQAARQAGMQSVQAQLPHLTTLPARPTRAIVVSKFLDSAGHTIPISVRRWPDGTTDYLYTDNLDQLQKQLAAAVAAKDTITKAQADETRQVSSDLEATGSRILLATRKHRAAILSSSKPTTAQMQSDFDAALVTPKA